MSTTRKALDVFRPGGLYSQQFLKAVTIMKLNLDTFWLEPLVLLEWLFYTGWGCLFCHRVDPFYFCDLNPVMRIFTLYAWLFIQLVR